jgi:dienelactone hydrolase
VVQVWYPAAQSDGDKLPYIDQPELRLKPLAKQMGLPKFLIQHIQQVKTNSQLNAEPELSLKNLPLLLFSHGLGGTRTQNTAQIEELVSQGYVVAAVDHPYDAYLTIFEDGSLADYRSGADGELTTEEFWAFRSPQLNTRVADMRYLLDEITNRQAADNTPWSMVDLGQIGIFGHSYGGATSILAAATDDRISSSVALDGWMLPVPEGTIDKGSAKPFLYIGQSAWDDPLNYQKLDKFLQNSGESATKVLLDGTKHYDFSDTPLLSNSSRRLGISGNVPRDELRALLNQELLTFFDNALRSSTLPSGD